MSRACALTAEIREVRRALLFTVGRVLIIGTPTFGPGVRQWVIRVTSCENRAWGLMISNDDLGISGISYRHPVACEEDLPRDAGDGDLVLCLDIDRLYIFDSASSEWIEFVSPGSGISIPDTTLRVETWDCSYCASVHPVVEYECNGCGANRS